MARAMDAHDAITLGLAAWGATLSTGLAVRQVVVDRPAVKLFIEKRAEAWHIRAVNVRTRPVQLTAFGVFLRNRAFRGIDLSMQFEDPSESAPDEWVRMSARLPVWLRESEDAVFWLPFTESTLQEIGAFRGAWLTDSAGRRYSRKWRRWKPARSVIGRYRLWRMLRWGRRKEAERERSGRPRAET
jgi:hypothetical protein